MAKTVYKVKSSTHLPGGIAVLEKYGIKHYSEAGKKSVEAKIKKYGKDGYKDYIKNFSQKGLQARLKKLEEKKKQELAENQPQNTP